MTIFGNNRKAVIGEMSRTYWDEKTEEDRGPEVLTS